jgi:hypothetical protein
MKYEHFSSGSPSSLIVFIGGLGVDVHVAGR